MSACHVNSLFYCSSSNSKQQLISPEEKPKPEATRESSCFGDSSVGIAAAAAGDSGRGGALDRKLQAVTTAVYGASLHSGKELLIRVTWTPNAAGATGLAVAFDDALSPSSRCAHHVLHKKRGSRSSLPPPARLWASTRTPPRPRTRWIRRPLSPPARRRLLPHRRC
ncbi:hypothetical protein [Oryza sativa Japonica Group]|uniref:Uncharacterized protein n=1 Tax=Oryza sativa subsp. japonica TaxID=39947 RepID=Q5ZDW0_ORYSJ|nr:hypothetical protein [Oryza sativa Japonica Group]BAD52568.1 hypothetical protein [Oryza sativa Japonica Group]